MQVESDERNGGETTSSSLENGRLTTKRSRKDSWKKRRYDIEVQQVLPAHELRRKSNVSRRERILVREMRNHEETNVDQLGVS